MEMYNLIPAVKSVTVWVLDLESEYIEVDAYKKVIVITNKYYASAIIDFLSSKKVEYTVQKKEQLTLVFIESENIYINNDKLMQCIENVNTCTIKKAKK
jgi:hypothetical protein|nr:MAG TPA: hypothetical protein [Crassvirales sp.]